MPGTLFLESAEAIRCWEILSALIMAETGGMVKGMGLLPSIDAIAKQRSRVKEDFLKLDGDLTCIDLRLL